MTGDVYVGGRRVGYFSGDDIYCDGQREGYFSGTDLYLDGSRAGYLNDDDLYVDGCRRVRTLTPFIALHGSHSPSPSTPLPQGIL